MDILKKLLDYQSFEKNPGLQRQIDAVEREYLLSENELPDEYLEVSAAGEVHLPPRKEKP